MTVLKIERLPHNQVLPEYKTEGAAGMDLCAAIYIILMDTFQK